jgi:hypothetical protein
VGDLAYPKREGVSNFFRKLGSFRFRGSSRLVSIVQGMPGVMGWPDTYTNTSLVTSRDLKFGVSDECIEGLILPDKEPGVVDEFEGEVSLRSSMNSIRSFLQSFVVLPERFTKKVFW